VQRVRDHERGGAAEHACLRDTCNHFRGQAAPRRREPDSTRDPTPGLALLRRAACSDCLRRTSASVSRMPIHRHSILAFTVTKLRGTAVTQVSTTRFPQVTQLCPPPRAKRRQRRDQALGEGYSHGRQRLGMHERYAVRLFDGDHRPRRLCPLPVSIFRGKNFEFVSVFFLIQIVCDHTASAALGCRRLQNT
jgi:hypothetical protein